MKLRMPIPQLASIRSMVMQAEVTRPSAARPWCSVSRSACPQKGRTNTICGRAIISSRHTRNQEQQDGGQDEGGAAAEDGGCRSYRKTAREGEAERARAGD